MAKLKILGGKQLKGEIIPQGAKNEALQILPATILHNGVSLIHNVPKISDVENLIKILKNAGAIINWEKNKNNKTFFCDSLRIDTSGLKVEYFLSEQFLIDALKLRGSITLLGPVLVRFGNCLVPQPGGDRIGLRPIYTHLFGLRELGVSYKVDKKTNTILAIAKRLQKADLILEEASVTGTANILMFSLGAKNFTTIYNAACEPYVQQLCLYLKNLNVSIDGVGTNLLKIDSRNFNNNFLSSDKVIEHTLLPDFVEVASLIGLSVITNSLLTIKNVKVNMLGNTLLPFRKLGVNFSIEGDDILMNDNKCYVVKNNDYGTIPVIYDQPWPMISPDILPILLTCAIQSKGTVMIHQRMFDSRLHFVDRLQKMGAQIVLCDPHRAIVVGLNRIKNLKGTYMESPDIRAGVALLIAGLSAEGETIIENIEQIDRGYESLDIRLSKLGAKLERI